MKRRLILLGVSFATLLAAFVVYWLVAGSGRVEYEAPENMPESGIGGLRTLGETEGRRPYIELRDDQQRLEAIWQGESWNKLAGDRYAVSAPVVELFQSDGRRVIIRGNEGVFELEEVAGEYEPRRGRLEGDVSVTFDRREGDAGLIRIFLDDLSFDNETLSIRTDGPVSLFSGEADILGRGLLIEWNEEPRELRELRIDRGEYMAVYQVPEELDVVSLPGTAATAPHTVEEDGPDADVAADAPPTPRPATAPAMELAAAAATQPATGRSEKDAPRKNIYQAVFHDAERGVNVDFGNRRVHGAAELSLTFQWDRQSDLGAGDRPAQGAQTRPTGDTQPATAPTTRPAGEPMIITWTGPLVLRPIGYTPDPSSETFNVSAVGERIVLSDEQAAAVCSSFRFRHPEQAGMLTGSEDRPVQMETPGGQEVVCGEVRFDRLAGTAELIGPGYMRRRIDAPTTTATTTAPAAARERIAWSRRVDVRFAEVEGPDDETQQTIEDAVFHGDVELVRGEGEDFVRCDQLHVWMAVDSDGQVYADRAVASGSVSARQEGRNIAANTVSLDLAPGEEGEDQLRPVSLEATGDVRVSEAGADEPLTAVCDRLTSNLVNRTAVLYGEPATVTQGTNRLSGNEIRLTEASESVIVDGPGSLAFTSTRDLNGNEQPRPRQVTVAWTKEMRYVGTSRQATFTGGVALDSEQDKVRCQRMTLLFEKLPDEEQPPAGEDTEPLALGLEGYSRRRIRKINADGEITLQTRRRDDAGLLTQRMTVWGEQLTYDAVDNTVAMDGEGVLLAEDYRTNEPDAAGDDNRRQVARPSKTRFEWHESMNLSQADRRVVLNGEVTMVHRSGRQVGLEGMEVPAAVNPAALPDGRRTALRCESLVAKFAPAEGDGDDDEREGDAITAGPRLGPMELFIATGKVNLRDGDRQVLGERLIYDRTRQMVVVSGYLQGQQPTNAHVYDEDPSGGRVRAAAFPKLRWNLETNRIDAEPVSGAGG